MNLHCEGSKGGVPVNKKYTNYPNSQQSPQEKSFGPKLGRESLCLFQRYIRNRPSQLVLVVKNPPPNAGNLRDAGSIPGSGRSPGGGHGNTLQYSCLKNPMGRGAWQATIHRVVKSWTLTEATSCARMLGMMVVRHQGTTSTCTR